LRCEEKRRRCRRDRDEHAGQRQDRKCVEPTRRIGEVDHAELFESDYAPQAPVAPQAGVLQKYTFVKVFVTIPFLRTSDPL